MHLLPLYIEAVKNSDHPVLWLCDPMHGNTKHLNHAIKVRYFADILKEAVETFRTHRENRSRCSGLHLEVSEEPSTTECLGGMSNPVHHISETGYTTACDPRLNPEQVLDLLKALFSEHCLFI
jgi:3-deoxy-D-arabino-heptulosonate 7-phosphate (DAHP) synthase class II